MLFLYKYRIAVCDDEKLIRNGISKFIGESFENAEVVASLSDGEEVIELLKTSSVDIIITDIRMKKVDGIAVAEYIAEKSPRTKFIFITGYQMFEYAQKAINLKASGFVSKPIDFEELKRLVKACMDEMEKTTNFAISTSNRMVMLHNSVKENIRNYYYGEMSLQAFRKAIENQDPEILEKNAELVHFSAASGEIKSDDPYRIWDDFADMENEFFKAFTVVGNSKNAVLVIVFSRMDSVSYRKMTDYLNELKKNVKIACRAEFSYNCIPLDNVCDIYVQNDRYFTELYLDRALAKNGEGVKDAEKIMMYSLSFNRIRSVADEILKSAVNEDRDKVQKIKHSLESARIRDDFKDIFKEMRSLRFERTNGDSAVITKALEYINNNYGSEISLNTLSDHLCISTAHFSRIFKRDTGKNFKDYVTDFRINKAKELFAKGRYSVKEVSYKVGFQNPLYFGQVFKRNVGMTPHEYSVKSQSDR